MADNDPFGLNQFKSPEPPSTLKQEDTSKAVESFLGPQQKADPYGLSAFLTTPQEPVTPPPSRGWIADTGASLAQGAADTVEMFARAYRAGNILPEEQGVGDETATWVLKQKEDLEKKYPGIFAVSKEASEPDAWFRKAWTGGVKAALPSIAGGAPGMVLGAVGGVPGAVAGYAASGGTMFGLQEYDQFKEEVINYNKKHPENAIPKEIWGDKALQSAFVEGGLEALNDVVEGLTFKLGGVALNGFRTAIKKTVGEAGEAAAKTVTVGETLRPTAKESAKKFIAGQLVMQPSEISTEMGQGYLEKKLRLEAGLPSQTTPWDDAVEAIGPTAVMTMLFGVGGHVMNKAQRNSIAKALENSDVPVAQRFQAARLIGLELEKYDKANNTELATKWSEAAVDRIAKTESIPLDEDIYKMQSLAEMRDAAAQKVAAEADLTKFETRGKEPSTTVIGGEEQAIEERPVEEKPAERLFSYGTFDYLKQKFLDSGMTEERSRELAQRVMGARGEETKVEPIVTEGKTILYDAQGTPVIVDKKAIQEEKVTSGIKPEATIKTESISTPSQLIVAKQEQAKKETPATETTPEVKKTGYEDILSKTGEPFSTKAGTTLSLKSRGMGNTHTAVPVSDGKWVGRRKDVVHTTNTLMTVPRAQQAALGLAERTLKGARYDNKNLPGLASRIEQGAPVTQTTATKPIVTGTGVRGPRAIAPGTGRNELAQTQATGKVVQGSTQGRVSEQAQGEVAPVKEPTVKERLTAQKVKVRLQAGEDVPVDEVKKFHTLDIRWSKDETGKWVEKEPNYKAAKTLTEEERETRADQRAREKAAATPPAPKVDYGTQLKDAEKQQKTLENKLKKETDPGKIEDIQVELTSVKQDINIFNRRLNKETKRTAVDWFGGVNVERSDRPIAEAHPLEGEKEYQDKATADDTIDKYTTQQPDGVRRLREATPGPMAMLQALRTMINHRLYKPGGVNLGQVGEHLKQLLTGYNGGRLDAYFRGDLEGKDSFAKRLVSILNYYEKAVQHLYDTMQKQQVETHEDLTQETETEQTELDRLIAEQNDELTDEEGQASISDLIGRESFTPDEVKQIIYPLLRAWKNRPEVRVYRNLKEMIEELGVNPLAQGVDANVAATRGVALFLGGRVYLFSDLMAKESRNEAGFLRSRNEVIGHLLHEVMGHYGIRGVLGENRVTVLNQLFSHLRNTPEFKTVLERYTKLDLSKAEGRALAVEETLSNLVKGRQIEKSLWQRIKEWFAGWANKLGFVTNPKSTVHDDMVQAILADSRRYVIDERVTSTPANIARIMGQLSVEEKGPVFFSKLEDVVANDKQLPKKTQSLKNYLAKFVKPSEMQWMDLDHFLKGKQNVTREELLAHVKSNTIDVNYVLKGNVTPKTGKLEAPPLDPTGSWGVENDRLLDNYLARLYDIGIQYDYNDAVISSGIGEIGKLNRHHLQPLIDSANIPTEQKNQLASELETINAQVEDEVARYRVQENLIDNLPGMETAMQIHNGYANDKINSWYDDLGLDPNLRGDFWDSVLVGDRYFVVSYEGMVDFYRRHGILADIDLPALEEKVAQVNRDILYNYNHQVQVHTGQAPPTLNNWNNNPVDEDADTAHEQAEYIAQERAFEITADEVYGVWRQVIEKWPQLDTEANRLEFDDMLLGSNEQHSLLEEQALFPFLSNKIPGLRVEDIPFTIIHAISDANNLISETYHYEYNQVLEEETNNLTEAPAAPQPTQSYKIQIEYDDGRTEIIPTLFTTEEAAVNYLTTHRGDIPGVTDLTHDSFEAPGDFGLGLLAVTPDDTYIRIVPTNVGDDGGQPGPGDQSVPSDRPKYGSYTLPGGENYRELLLTWGKPKNKVKIVTERVDQEAFTEWLNEEGIWPSNEHGDTYTPETILQANILTPEQRAWVNNYIGQNPLDQTDTENREHSAARFTSGHYEEEDILAHVRFKDRTDANGKKVLFIEEIQSDWHQSGKRSGYRQPLREQEKYTGTVVFEHAIEGRVFAQYYGQPIREDIVSPYTGATMYFKGDEIDQRMINNLVAVGIERILVTDTSYAVIEGGRPDRYRISIFNPDGHLAHTSYSDDEIHANSNLEYELVNWNHTRYESKVESAPFKDTWHELAMKRMIRWAAEHGYDGVAWTTGQQQADRYNLARYINHIKITGRTGYQTLDAYQHDGGHITRDFSTKEELAELVGPELTSRIWPEIQELGNGNTNVYSDLNISVGGEGMKKFYDEMLPGFAKRYLQQWDIKPQTMAIAEKARPVTQQPGFYLNDKMKQDVVLKGQPLWSIDRPKLKGDEKAAVKKFGLAKDIDGQYGKSYVLTNGQILAVQDHGIIKELYPEYNEYGDNEIGTEHWDKEASYAVDKFLRDTGAIRISSGGMNAELYVDVKGGHNPTTDQVQTIIDGNKTYEYDSVYWDINGKHGEGNFQKFINSLQPGQMSVLPIDKFTNRKAEQKYGPWRETTNPRTDDKMYVRGDAHIEDNGDGTFSGMFTDSDPEDVRTFSSLAKAKSGMDRELTTRPYSHERPTEGPQTMGPTGQMSVLPEQKKQKILNMTARKFGVTNTFSPGYSHWMMPNGQFINNQRKFIHGDVQNILEQNHLYQYESDDHLGTDNFKAIMPIFSNATGSIRFRGWTNGNVSLEMPEGFEMTQAQFKKLGEITKEQGNIWYDITDMEGNILRSGEGRTLNMVARALKPDTQKTEDKALFSILGPIASIKPNSSKSTVQEIFSEATLAALKTIAAQRPSAMPHMSFMERLLKSPEWYAHPVLKKIVAFAINRHDNFYERFNKFNDLKEPVKVGDKNYHTLIDATNALRKTNQEQYDLLSKVVDDGDTFEWKKGLPENSNITYEEYLRQKGLPEIVQKLYKLHRAAYDHALDIMTAPMEKLVKDIEDAATAKGEKPNFPTMQVQDEKGERKTVTLKEAVQHMNRWRGTYAPRLRDYGGWVIKSIKGETEHRFHRTNRWGAERLAARLRREGHNDVSVGEKEQMPEVLYQSLRLADTAKAIETALTHMKNPNAEVEAKFHNELIKQMADVIRMRGFRSTMIKRREGPVIKGYIEDANERFVKYIMSISAGMAKAETARDMMGALTQKYETVDGKRKKVGGIDPEKEPRVYEVAQKYIEEQLRNSDYIDRVIANIKGVATFKYLGFNPRSILVNVLAVPTTVPTAIRAYALGGKGNFASIGRALAGAGVDFGRVMAGGKLSDVLEQEFIDEIHDKGYSQPQYTREAVGTIERGFGSYWQKTLGFSMKMFQRTEEWNRGTTMLAAYRLIKEQNPKISEEEARALAHEASNRAHGIYGSATLPEFAQGTGWGAKTGQLVYTYQKFSHNYLQMLYDVGFKKKDLPGFLWALLSPIVLGGAMVIPFKDAMFAVAGAILKAMGVDDDPEKWVWDKWRKIVGKEGEKITRHGLLGAANIDVSGSLSIGVGIPQTGWDVLGVVGGVGQDIATAADFLGTGQAGRAAERIVPTGAANLLKAYREMNTGVVTTKGQRVFKDDGTPFRPSGGETVLRVLGARTASLATLQERTWEAKKEEKRFADDRDKINQRYRAYLSDPKGDPKDFNKVMDEVYKYNNSVTRTGHYNIPFITKETMRSQAKEMFAPNKREFLRIAD